ncbi:MAG: hypothetical protein H6Q89_2047 [Myxococcaceae bacterium]|nr:hypothetical protein [Myxococcaceae bacterium]
MNTLPTAPRPLRRGQALVLSALGMVLLVLMVTMTLSFGTKAKQKMEVQVVADQAAYSTSVATARTYNVLSMVNRVMIAHMTAMLGIQSAISFATNWFVMVQAFFLYYTLEILNQLTCCNWGCAFYGCVTALYVLLTRWIPTLRELMTLIGRFPRADQAAAQQAMNTSLACNLMFAGQGLTVSMQLWNALKGQKTADRVMNKAKGGVADWSVPSGAADVTTREAGFIAGMGPIGVAFGVGAINESNLILMDRHAVVASMASRGHFFTTNRSTWFFPNGVRTMMQAALGRIGARNDITNGGWQHMGKGYFGDFFHSDSFLPTTSRFALADDHGFGIIRRTGPAARRPLTWPLVTFVTVMSNNSTGFHIGLATIGVWMDALHTVPAICLLNCPSAWTNFADYSPWLVADWRDNFAQPKAPTTVFKDAQASTPDPYNLLFNLRFTPAGSSTGGLDMKHGAGPGGGGVMVRDGASGMANISRQVGYSTGITYYHRAGHWKEPPNLFNAFWRAGITRADIDRAATATSIVGVPLTPDNSHDIEDTLRQAGAGWAASAYCELYRKGYQGIAQCP